MQLKGESVGALDMINTILSYGFSHHYPVAKGDYQPELMEIACWLKLGVLDKVAYRTWMQMK